MRNNHRPSHGNQFHPSVSGKTATLCLGVFLLVLGARPAAATHPCTSPLILDLDNYGVETTGVERPVQFDIDGDGWKEEIGWTMPEGREGFLWLDGNHNNRVDDGTELFGTATLLPSGEPASNGFEALAVYDDIELGGDGDGQITPSDLVWPWLRLWVDENHDGISQGSEIAPLARYGVVAIDLAYETLFKFDGHGNLHAQHGTFVLTVTKFGRPFLRAQDVEDIFFLVVPSEP